MAFNYNILEKAVEDINEIIDYIASDNPKAGLKLYQTFLKQFDYLSIFPEVGRLRKEFQPPVRSLAVGNYTIYFREVDPITIVRVLHGARNISGKHLNE
jgi:plasmid stabilization system protein ParE